MTFEINDVLTILTAKGYTKIIDYSDHTEQPLTDYGWGSLGSVHNTEIREDNKTGLADIVDIESGIRTHRARF